MIVLAVSMKSCWNQISSLAGGNLKPSSDYVQKLIAGNEECEDQIAVIEIKGVIGEEKFCSADPERICRLIRSVNEDDNVKAIVVSLDTPGGEVTAADRIYRELKLCTKPVIAQMNSLAASGGYYIACGAKKIVANRMTLTGSIGVIIEGFDYSGLLTKVGVKPRMYVSGPMKAMLNGAKATTPQEDQVVHTLVQNTYLEFAKIVSESRKIPLEQITKGIIGDGRVFDGQQALKLKLVDSLGYLDDAVSEAAKAAGKDLNKMQVVLVEEPFSFDEFLMSFRAGDMTRKLQISLPGANTGTSLQKGKLYFLPFDF